MTSLSPGITPTRLRQIAFAAFNLEKAKYLLTKVIGTEILFIDPRVTRWGLKNVLVAIGGDVIEVVSPTVANTTAAGRFLTKRGQDTGYMLIMQTESASNRRSYLTSKNFAQVIFTHEDEEAVCVQYHPKGIKGGMMPELDSHYPSPSNNPTPLTSRFSPWHPCGSDYTSYSAAMKRCSHLHFVEAVCRLAPGDRDTIGAAKQWEELFGVPRSGDELVFLNMTVRFVRGEEGENEGLVSVKITVEGEDMLSGILERARREGVWSDGLVEMLGIKWYFVRASEITGNSKL